MNLGFLLFYIWGYLRGSETIFGQYKYLKKCQNTIYLFLRKVKAKGT
jgi:hypothetical protein